MLTDAKIDNIIKVFVLFHAKNDKDVNNNYSFRHILIDKFIFSHKLRKLVGVINFSRDFQKYPYNDPMSS